MSMLEKLEREKRKELTGSSSSQKSEKPSLEKQNELIAARLLQIEKDLKNNTEEQKKTQNMLKSVYSKLEENQTDLNDKVVKLGSTGVDNYILAEQRKIITSFAERTDEFTKDYKKQLERRTEQANKIISDVRNTQIKTLSIYEYGKMIGFYVVLILVILTLAKAIHFGPYEGLGFSWFMKQIEGIGWLYWTFQGLHMLFWLFIVYTLYRGFKSYRD